MSRLNGFRFKDKEDPFYFKSSKDISEAFVIKVTKKNGEYSYLHSKSGGTILPNKKRCRKKHLSLGIRY